MPTVVHRYFALALLLACVPPMQGAEPAVGWSQFLGAGRDGLSRETGLRLDWTEKKPREVWKAPIGGGFSSIACVGDRLYTMVSRDKRDYAVCLDASNGKDVWAVELAPAYRDRQSQGTGPRATPTYHDGKVYCLHPMGDLFCLSAKDGSEVWKVNILRSARRRTGPATCSTGGWPIRPSLRVILSSCNRAATRTTPYWH
jgi:outer membrane protein assembly factor BamB